MTKVLIALDYGPTAQKVAEEGYALAKLMGADVILLHIVDDPVYYSSLEYSPIMGFAGYSNTVPMQLNSVESLKKASLDFLDKSKVHLGDDRIKTMVKEGDFAESIMKVAKDYHVHAIVMGTHSRKWMENIGTGSVTEKVLRHSTIPLYIIPTKKH